MARPRAVWIGIAVAFVAAAAVHVVAIVGPRAPDGSPTWRHALFAGIDLAVAVGVLVRPRALWLPFGALTAQQLYSHGTAAVRAWQEGHRVDWASIAVVIGMPIVLGLLVRERRG